MLSKEKNTKAVSVESPPQVTALPPTLLIGSRRARLLTSSAALRSPQTCFRLPHCLGCFAACGFSRPPALRGCRLPAAAGHRAAVVEIADIGGPRGLVASCQRSCLRKCYPPIGCRRSAIHLHQRLQLPIPILSVTAIGDIETFHDSRLRRNFASVECEGQCKASVVGHSLRPTTSVQCEGDKVVSCGRKAAL